MVTREMNLRRLAHERIEAGELPPKRSGRMHDRPGAGEACALCGAPILFDEVDHEMRGNSGRRTYRFHQACHAVWLAESSVESAENTQLNEA